MTAIYRLICSIPTVFNMKSGGVWEVKKIVNRQNSIGTCTVISN